MPTMSLTDFAVNQANPEQQRAVANSFIEAKSVMTDIPVKTENTLTAKGTRHVAVPSVAEWVNLGQALPSVINTPKPWSEKKYLKGFRIPIPRILVESKEGGGAGKLFADQADPVLQAHSADIDYRFFNNNQLASGDIQAPKCFNGLRTRLSAPWRSVYDIPATCKFDLGGADLRLSAVTAAALLGVGATLSRALERMGNEDGTNVVFYANEYVWSVLENSYFITNNSLFGNDKDVWGDKILTFRNAKIRRCSRLISADPTSNEQTYVLPNTESADGETLTGSTYSSIFGVHYGEKKFTIEQFKTPDMDDPKLLDDHITYESAFMNAYSIVQESTISVVQIHNFRVV